MKTQTICKETEQQLIEVASKLGYHQLEKSGSEGARKKVLVFKSDRLIAPIVVHMRIPTIVTAHTDERDRCSVRASVVFRV